MDLQCHSRLTWEGLQVVLAPAKNSQNLHNASQLEDNDIIYVPHTEVGKFVNDILDGVSTNIVVVSWDSIDWPPASIKSVTKLLNHPHVLKWFCQNQPKYGHVDVYHPKIASFPYGLKEGMPWEGGTKIITLPSYKQIFFGGIWDKSLLDKTNVIFVGPLWNNGDGGHSRIPQSTERMTLTYYFLKMANDKNVVSPNGDRPDCYCHYNAIGLGAVPITQLDPVIRPLWRWICDLLQYAVEPRAVRKRVGSVAHC